MTRRASACFAASAVAVGCHASMPEPPVFAAPPVYVSSHVVAPPHAPPRVVPKGHVVVRSRLWAMAVPTTCRTIVRTTTDFLCRDDRSGLAVTVRTFTLHPRPTPQSLVQMQLDFMAKNGDGKHYEVVGQTAEQVAGHDVSVIEVTSEQLVGPDVLHHSWYAPVDTTEGGTMLLCEGPDAAVLELYGACKRIRDTLVTD